MRVGLGDKPPVSFAAERRQPSIRIEDGLGIIASASFNEQNGYVEICREFTRDDGPGRPRAANDVIITRSLDRF